jgi:pimeloyl-ACP methyl ester carboxylesterase
MIEPVKIEPVMTKPVMIERSITFGPDNGLVGTLCLPTQLPDGQTVVGQLLFNAGIVHRVGPHRINVRLARLLAARGIPSLRFDLSGLGDSARALTTRPFMEQVVSDIRSAIDLLCAQAAVRQVSLFGFCSGGRYGFATAVVDERVAGLILYDAYAYPTMQTAWYRYRGRIRQYGLAKVVGTWVARAPSIVASRLRAKPMRKNAQAGSDDPTSYQDLSKSQFADRIKALHGRGVKVALIHSGEGENYNYRHQLRDSFKDSGVDQLVTYDYLPDMDHNVMIMAKQTQFMRLLADWTVELDQRCRNSAAV